MTATLTRRHAGLLAAASLFTLPRLAAARVGPESFAPLVKQVMPTVVNIAVTETVASGNPPAGLPPELQRQFRERFKQRRERVTGAGSGYIIDPDGTIVTNHHVVGSAEKITITTAAGAELTAKLVGSDELTDVAVIKVTAPDRLPAARWGDSRALEVGDWVIAAGNPFGLGGSVTAGIVSARGRDLGAGPFDDFIQIDAPINPGNSGGPLFNTEGEVVGMNSAIFSPTGSSVGIGFAIPSELVSRIVGELRERGRIDRGWLGVSVQDVEAGPKGAAGVGIAGIDRNGPAFKAGLKAGDIVTAIDDHTVETARALIKNVALATPGSSVKLSIRRAGKTITVPVTIGRRPRMEEN